MAQRSRFFDSVAGDRIYSADAFAQVISALIGDGRVAGRGVELVVSESNPPDMSVEVGTGAAFIDGYFFEVYAASEEVAIDAADAVNPRIDRVIIRRSLANREATLVVLKGAPAAVPAPPALTQDPDGTYEVSLAQVRVNASAVSIVDANITDERPAAAQGPDIAAILLAASGHRHEGVDGSGRRVRHTDLDPATVTANQHHDEVHDHDGDGSGVVPHAATSGRTADDHHNKSHAHDGADGTGTVAHAATTGRTANDHHNKVHGSDHQYPAGADAILVNSLGGLYRNNNQVISGGALYMGFVGTSPEGIYGPSNIADGDVWIKV